MEMTLAEQLSIYEARLESLEEEPEALAFVFREMKRLDFTSFLLHLRQPISAEDQELLEKIFNQLAAHRSPQYILGHTTFLGESFQVDERVLIPRPETEELVQLILEREPSDAPLSVIDIGTGSGAIAISLAKQRPQWQITASDLSADALTMAKENAQRLQADLEFRLSDVLEEVEGSFDVIVSNPPYIAREDRDEVGLNVWISEPHMALFAEEDGYAIYRKILEQAQDRLRPRGRIYFEIGYKQGAGLTQLAHTYFPEKVVEVLKDQYGHDRMVVIRDHDGHTNPSSRTRKR